MGSQDDDNIGVVLGVVFGVIALVVALVLGATQYSKNQMAVKPAVAAVAADGASVKVVNGIVMFYFASGKSDLAAGANEALTDIVRAAAAGKSVVISGFHDATGDPAMNAELAKQRALKVRDTLGALGVAQDKVELSRHWRRAPTAKPAGLKYRFSNAPHKARTSIVASLICQEFALPVPCTGNWNHGTCCPQKSPCGVCRRNHLSPRQQC